MDFVWVIPSLSYPVHFMQNPLIIWFHDESTDFLCPINYSKAMFLQYGISFKLLPSYSSFISNKKHLPMLHEARTVIINNLLYVIDFFKINRQWDAVDGGVGWKSPHKDLTFSLKLNLETSGLQWGEIDSWSSVSKNDRGAKSKKKKKKEKRKEKNSRLLPKAHSPCFRKQIRQLSRGECHLYQVSFHATSHQEPRSSTSFHSGQVCNLSLRLFKSCFFFKPNAFSILLFSSSLDCSALSFCKQ